MDISVLDSFKAQLSAFTIKKNAVYLPYTSALPKTIIEDMLKSYFGIERQNSNLSVSYAGFIPVRGTPEHETVLQMSDVVKVITTR